MYFNLANCNFLNSTIEIGSTFKLVPISKFLITAISRVLTTGIFLKLLKNAYVTNPTATKGATSKANTGTSSITAHIQKIDNIAAKTKTIAKASHRKGFIEPPLIHSHLLKL